MSGAPHFKLFPHPIQILRITPNLVKRGLSAWMFHQHDVLCTDPAWRPGLAPPLPNLSWQPPTLALPNYFVSSVLALALTSAPLPLRSQLVSFWLPRLCSDLTLHLTSLSFWKFLEGSLSCSIGLGGTAPGPADLFKQLNSGFKHTVSTGLEEVPAVMRFLSRMMNLAWWRESAGV